MVTTGTEDRTRILNQIGSVHQGGRKEEGVWFRIMSLSPGRKRYSLQLRDVYCELLRKILLFLTHTGQERTTSLVQDCPVSFTEQGQLSCS